MNLSKKTLIALALSAAAPLIANAETVTYSGTAETAVLKSLMPLGNGDSVVSIASFGVAAISTTPPTLLSLKCSGMGLVGTETLDTQFYCNLAENETDSIDLMGTETHKKSSAKVIGGSGKWEGATGTGTFTRLETGENRVKTRFEIKVTTP